MSRLVLLGLYIVAAMVFSRTKRRELAAILGAVGGPAAIFAVASVGLLILTQATGLHRSLYPYAAWPMYTEPNPSRITWSVIARRASGVEESLAPARILRGPDPRPLMGHIYGFAEAADTTTSEARRREVEAAALALATGLARLDRDRNPQDPIVALNVHQCELPGSPPWDRESIVCDPEATLSLEISADPSEPSLAP